MKYTSNTGTIGKAYGFFDCRASENEIRAEIPTIRELAQTPSEVDISLIGDIDSMTGDSYLTSIAKDMKNAGIKYALEATYPGETNEKTADEVVTFLNQTYQTELFEKGEPFRGEIVFEKEGEYVFRD